MESPPSGVSGAEFDRLFAARVARLYQEVPAGGYVCRTCGAEIQQCTAYISIHDARFSGCAGSGQVRQIPWPFCPSCEDIPADKTVTGCVHV